MIYDIFYVSKKIIDESDWLHFRQRFPTSQKIDNVKTLDDIKKRSFTKFFWVVWDDLTVSDDFSFDYRVDKWDEEYIHVWLNNSYRDGICLFPKTALVSQKEFDHRFYFNKKEIDVVASQPKPFDIIFISYNEINADENFNKLVTRFPTAKRVHGIKGIHQAHIEAAKLSNTEMFWVIDGDAVLEDSFNFSADYVPHYDAGNRIVFYKTVRVWKSRNPVNDLEYGNGGVKLLPKNLTLNMATNTTDMTTSISEFFKPMLTVSNINSFNTDAFTTWRSAFRECAKLASKVIDRGYDDETDQRLVIWCMSGSDRPFGKYAIGGARAGKEFGERYIGIDEILVKINDFEWLESEFKKWQSLHD